MTDSCPNCLRPAVRPSLVMADGDGTSETYRCPRCRHAWTCSWGPHEDLPEPEAPPAA